MQHNCFQTICQPPLLRLVGAVDSQTNLKPGTEVLITAIAYHEAGESSVPAPEGKRLLKIPVANPPR